MEITRSGECTWGGGSSCSFCFLQYWYGLASIEEENKSAPFKKVKYFFKPKRKLIMEILIAMTKTCPYRPKLADVLRNAWLAYKAIYFEDHPELLEKYQLQHSPILMWMNKWNLQVGLKCIK